MNKKKSQIPKNFEKKVFHVILPKRIWRDFDHWWIDMGCTTRLEAIRVLIRQAPQSTDGK